MNGPTSGPPVMQGRPRRNLNTTRIKSNIVFVAAVVTALLSGITGFGPQLAFAPMLIWMLGFGSEKAQGTALRFAVVASASVVIGGKVAFTMSKAHIVSLSIPAFLASSLAIFIGATLGALVASPLAPPISSGRRRIGMFVGMALMLYVIVQTAHLSGWTNPHFAAWNTLPLLLLLGIVVGALTQALGLPGGVLMVAALYYLGGYAPEEAVSISLLVVALAAILPATGYARRGLVDATYSWPAALGGILGGALGGLLRVRLTDSTILIAYAVLGMFLIARELARIAGETPPSSSSS